MAGKIFKLFFKGVLLENPKRILIQQTENVHAGRQRAYLFYFAQAKRSKTREERIAKYLPQILKGKGLND